MTFDTLILAATIMLGLDLFKANNVATIIWIVACVVLALVLEIGIQVIGKSSSSGTSNLVDCIADYTSTSRVIHPPLKIGKG